MTTTRRAALYLRVSTDKQTVENQELQLRHVAERRGWEVVEVTTTPASAAARDGPTGRGSTRCSMMRTAGTSTSSWSGRLTGWAGP
jgi:hypothetical protein